MQRIFSPWLFEKLHIGHRKSHFKRTQYWKHSSVKQPRNVVEPLKSNKYVALNCQTQEALIFKPFFPTKDPENCFSQEKGLPVIKLLPWSWSVFVHVLVNVCAVLCLPRKCFTVTNKTQHWREWPYTDSKIKDIKALSRLIVEGISTFTFTSWN